MNHPIHIVTMRLKAGTFEQMDIVWERFRKYICTATNMHVTKMESGVGVFSLIRQSTAAKNRKGLERLTFPLVEWETQFSYTSEAWNEEKYIMNPDCPEIVNNSAGEGQE
jgi:hypothetical protein